MSLSSSWCCRSRRASTSASSTSSRPTAPAPLEAGRRGGGAPSPFDARPRPPRRRRSSGRRAAARASSTACRPTSPPRCARRSATAAVAAPPPSGAARPAPRAPIPSLAAVQEASTSTARAVVCHRHGWLRGGGGGGDAAVTSPSPMPTRCRAVAGGRHSVAVAARAASDGWGLVPRRVFQVAPRAERLLPALVVPVAGGRGRSDSFIFAVAAVAAATTRRRRARRRRPPTRRRSF